MLIQRYLGRQLLLSTLVIATGLTMVIWLTQSLKLLDLVINGGAPLQLFGYMLLLTVPKFFELILPLALAISVVFFFNKLIADSELVVMQACGLSPWQIGKTVAWLAVIVGICVFLIGGWLTPQANQELDRMRGVAKSDFSVNLLRPRVFNTLGDNVVVYLSERSSLGNLKGILIHFKPEGQPSSTIWAKSGGIIMKNNQPIVTMRDGIKQDYNPKTKKVESLSFASYHVNLSSILNKVSKGQSVEPNEHDLPELLTMGPSLEDPRHRREFMAEANVRMSRPLLVMSFALCAMTPFLLGRFNRRGQAWRVVHVILMLVALQAAYLGCISLAEHSMLGDSLLYAVAIIPSLIMAFCIIKAHPSGKWRRTVAEKLQVTA